ncbi:hypothetical protein GDO81_001039 [Engystomops pustulosus]|uniref:Uncharacterized protein n=1 Tax=Engystomops pustulosus TaxID=76066 RepID=A0AAV7DCV8_ENGPU|nr:hypothetical protein GDO81_001039 [Engystomops pustulosus]
MTLNNNLHNILEHRVTSFYLYTLQKKSRAAMFACFGNFQYPQEPCLNVYIFYYYRRKVLGYQLYLNCVYVQFGCKCHKMTKYDW